MSVFFCTGVCAHHTPGSLCSVWGKRPLQKLFDEPRPVIFFSLFSQELSKFFISPVNEVCKVDYS